MASQQLERELSTAQEMGRWLSDDELRQIDHEKRLIRKEQEQNSQRRQKLALFTVICLALPPLWPVAAGISLHLLFPQTFRRFVWFAGGSLLLLASLGVGVGVLVLSLLWMLIS